MKKLLALALCLLMLAPSALAQEPQASVLQVHQMMLGCADGFLIRFGDIDIMIDGGNAIPESPTDDVVNYLRDAGVTTLDAYIITHWHLDHCMNLNNVLARFGDGDTVVYSPSPALHEDYDPLANGVYKQMKDGQTLTFGTEETFTITCVGPEMLTQNGRGNPDSLNFVLQYGDWRMLFTGDFAASKNINLVHKDICSNVDVLKFPHHGIQPFEIGEMACRTTSPEYVLVPGVVNKYKIWDFFDDNGVKFPKENVFSNADGHVVLLTDGQGCFEVMVHQNPADWAPVN